MNEAPKVILVLDRVEEEFAVLISDDGTTYELPRELLPEGYREGDTYSYDGFSLTPDSEETQARKARISEKLNRLFSEEE